MFNLLRTIWKRKLFQVCKRVETRGVFVTQVKSEIVDTLEARNQEEAQRTARLLHGDDCYAIPYYPQ